MVITRQVLAKQLSEYLQHNVTIEQLVDWAERAMMEAEFDPVDRETLRDITGRIGLADVRAFGLTWEDCEAFLSRLGYRAKIDVFQST
jgi:cobyrinic acid a,c-diamide synthase